MIDTYDYLKNLKVGKNGMYVSYEGINFIAHEIMGSYLGANGKFYDPKTRKVFYWFKGNKLPFEIINDYKRSRLSKYELLHYHPMISNIIGAFRKIRKKLINTYGNMKQVNREYRRLIDTLKENDKIFAKSERRRLRQKL